MAKKNNPTYHVMPHENGWSVKREGASRASKVVEAKPKALKEARVIAMHQAPCNVVIHKKDGTVQEQRSYT